MSRAPLPRSSAGCKIITNVPDHLSFIEVNACAVPTQLVMWVSWPQACITPDSMPSSVVARTFEAKGKPVCSTTGRPSISARIITTGPGPFLSTATTPVPPTFSVTSKPKALARLASLAAVFTSKPLNSG